MDKYQKIIETYAIPWGIQIIAALAILIIGRIIAKLIVRAIKKVMHAAEIEITLNNFLCTIIQTILMVLVVVAALNQLGINTTSVLTIFAAAGLAIGLAFKDSLSNFAAGIMLIMFKPFKIGDYIEAANISGIVEQIKVFSTLMRTSDNREITVPNSQIYSGIITNFSARDTRRIDITIGISYDDNIGTTKSLVEDILRTDNRILKDPAPTITVADLAESSVNLAIRPWVKSSHYAATRSDLLQTIKDTFEERGISIPYPQQDTHIIETK